MEKLQCKLIIHNNKKHLKQIFAGFIELEKKNIITLKKEVLNDSEYCYAEAIIDNKYRIIYDTMDSGEIFLPNVDFNKITYYFKRSYNKIIASQISNKIKPLGLNYSVDSKYGDYDDFYTKFKNILISIIKKKKTKFYIEDFEYNPKVNEDFKICFLTRVWDPKAKDIKDESFSREIEKINKFRVKCIKKCKEKYGEQFIGGLQDTEYARLHYKDLIVSNEFTDKSKFIECIKKSNVCVATTGLHNSIGWKLPEYVAASRAIITEELNYEITGKFKEGVNYLMFKDSDELIKNIEVLKSDKELLYNMMIKNNEYYNKFIRPDKLILNTLNMLQELN